MSEPEIKEKRMFFYSAYLVNFNTGFISYMRFLLFTFLLISSASFSQAIDVQHYRYELQLGDETDKINGKATITIKFLQPTKDFSLDLVQTGGNGKGMKIESVKGKTVAGFQQVKDRLLIQLKNTSEQNAIDRFQVSYRGVPADGLIISKNKFGDRTFFSDNWPNRARHWIPCNDVPNDKATVEFLVTAPSYYQVVSNGVQVEETNLDKDKKLTHWKEEVPIPTKVMVIGAAQFAVGKMDSNYSVPVTAWVYPQDKSKGFYDYALAPGILQFFTEYIGPFPFEKLANVESKTIFGGMENAGAIFYAENSVSGNRKSEDLISHEIAHQWFGDMATEKSFAHLWLSEGFATYLTNIYWEKKYGNAAFQERLKKDRQQAVGFSKVNRNSIVDTTSGLMELLNANSYQKGGWVLHMLRREAGDELFQRIIRSYYEKYKGSNADTRDFQKVAEEVSGKNLEWFFDQWLYQPGIPKIEVQWKMQGNDLVITVQQTGKTVFQFPLTIGYLVGGKMQEKTIGVARQKETFALPMATKPTKLVLDPNTDLLFDGNVSETK